MKIGITSGTVAEFGEKRFQKLSELGFDAVDFNLMDVTAPVYHCQEQELPALIALPKALAEQSGIEIFQTHGPWTYPPADSTEAQRATALTHMRRAIRATALLGAKYMAVHPLFPFGTREPENVGEQTFAINVDFWHTVIPTAKEHGVIVCLENMPFHHYSHSRPADILRIIRAVDDPHFAMCLDTGHVNVFPELDLYEEILHARDVLRLFHIHDNDGKSDLHQLPLFGKLNWENFARAWHEIGFEGVFSFEAAPPRKLSLTLFEKVLGLMPQLARDILKME